MSSSLQLQFAAEEAYWLRRLADTTVPVGVPTDYERPEIFDAESDTVQTRFDQVLSDAVLQRCSNRSSLLFVFCLAGMKICLHKYTGADDIVIGTSIHEELKETAQLNGILALRSTVRSAQTINDFLGNVKRTVAEAYTNQQYPFERIVQLLNIPWPANRAPLFDVVLTLDSIHNDDSTRHLKNDLTVRCSVEDGRIRVVYRYRTCLFNRKSIELLSHNYERVMQALSSNPGTTISDLALQMAEQSTDLSVQQVHSPAIASRPVHVVIQEQAQQVPDRIAVLHRTECLTYREMDKRANQLARYLTAIGVQPDAPVGVYLERSAGLVVALLGILKAGAAYLPLDPEWPRARRELIVKAAGVRVLVTEAAMLEEATGSIAHAVCLDRDWNTVSESTRLKPADHASLDSLAYVLYTSGSTGVPKGVMVTHDALANHMRWLNEEFAVAGADRVLQKTPVGFDASVWEFYAPLMRGASLVLADQGGHRDVHYLIETITYEAITILQVVPSLLRMMVEQKAFAACTSLRIVCCGGESLSADLKRRFHRTLQSRLVNLYGPTEATIDATFCTCDPADRLRANTIGVPIENVQTYVVDPKLNAVPPAMRGALCIGGAGLARGYLNQPSQTAEAFIPNPFRSEPGARLYKTGDQARVLYNGDLEFLGRNDHQIKIHGYRIEAGEIERVLEEHDSVRTSVITSITGVTGHDQLVAHVEAERGKTFSATECAEYLRSRLPMYMIPSTFVLLQALPLLTNGKVDRSALPPPPAAAERSPQDSVRPRSEIEQAIAGIWQEALKLDKIGVNENFFDLGGNSLLMPVIHSRLVALRDIRIADLFKYPTVSALAKYISSLESTPRN